MKKLLNGIMGISLLSLLLIVGTAHRAKAQDVAVSYQNFYDELSPYGQWVSDAQYGNVWVPNEGGDFRPYGTRGHWAMTDYGNTWVSDDPWGWACYHYGRWTYDGYYGWLWVPGYEWAPAWVNWRYGGDQCGWAPMGPGISVGMTFNCPDSWWVFVGPQYMYEPNCIHYWRGPEYNGGYMRQTTIVNNYYEDNHTHVHYNYGPRADVIERDTHHPVQVYKVSQSNRPGAPSMSGNRISMYRPNVDRGSANTARPSNVIAAPHQIGRPQAANNMSATKPAPFRQQVQNGTLHGGQGQPNGAQGGNRQPNAAPQGGNRAQPNAPQGGNRAQPNTPQGNRTQPVNNQPHNNPVNNQPRNNPASNQPAPNRQPANNNATQHNNRFQQPSNNTQPQHQQTAPNRPMSQPQPQRSNPMPQPQPQRQQPMQQPQRQMPAPQPQRSAPAPRPEAPHEEPHEGGGGRR